MRYVRNIFSSVLDAVYMYICIYLYYKLLSFIIPIARAMLHQVGTCLSSGMRHDRCKISLRVFNLFDYPFGNDLMQITHSLILYPSDSVQQLSGSVQTHT